MIARGIFAQVGPITPVGGTSGQIQYNNAGALGGAAKATVSSEGQILLLDTTATPATPAGGIVTFSRQTLGRSTLAQVDSSGRLYEVQGSAADKRVIAFATNANSTNTTSFGITLSVGGTLVAVAPASTNYVTRIRKVRTTSAASAGSTAHLSGNALAHCREQGFYLSARFGIGGGAKANMVGLFGLYATSANFTGADVGTEINFMGFGFNAAHTTMQVFSNDATGAATLTDLGANFPVDTVEADFYRIRLFCAPAGTTVYWEITRLNTGHVASGTFSADIPAATQLLRPILNLNTRAAAAVSLDVADIYIETDS